MIRVEITVLVRRDDHVVVSVGGDRLEAQPLCLPDGALDAIRKDVNALEALVPGWRPRDKARFESLRVGVGRALGGLLFGRPELFDGLETTVEGQATTSVLAREITVALRQLQGRRGTIRLVLAFEDPMLDALPWELLIWPDNGGINLGTDPRFSLVRATSADDPGFRPPSDRLRLLATVSDPKSFGLATPLGPTWDGIVGHLAVLDDTMDVVVAPAQELDTALDGEGYSVLLALGHGSQRLQLMLPREGGGGPPFIEVDAGTFRDRFAGGGTPRLAVLIMCYSGGDAGSAGAGVSAARAMVEAGCAAVVAMQGTVYLPAAEQFAGVLLRRVAAGDPLDEAVQAARHTLARYGQENAHREAPDHAYRPVLMVRQSADLAPLVKPPRRNWWPVVGVAAAALVAAILAWPSTPDEASHPASQPDAGLPAEAFPEMVDIPAGKGARVMHWKGSRPDTPARYATAEISGVRLAKRPISQAQWKALMGSNPAFDHAGNGGADDWPVNRVNTYEALLYLNRLSEAANETACYQLNECEGEVGTACDTGVRGCVGGYTCRRVERVADCTGYRLPTLDELTVASGAQPRQPFPTRAEVYEALRAMDQVKDPHAGTVNGLEGMLNGGQTPAWPPKPGDMITRFRCATQDGRSCTFATLHTDAMRLRAANLALRPAQGPR